VRRGEEDIVGPALQHLAAVDDVGVGDRRSVDPFAALGADRKARHVVGREQGEKARIGMRRQPELILYRAVLMRVVRHAQGVLALPKGTIEILGRQVERAGIEAHHLLHQPLQRVAIVDDGFAEARQIIRPAVGSSEAAVGEYRPDARAAARA